MLWRGCAATAADWPAMLSPPFSVQLCAAIRHTQGRITFVATVVVSFANPQSRRLGRNPLMLTQMLTNYGFRPSVQDLPCADPQNIHRPASNRTKIHPMRLGKGKLFQRTGEHLTKAGPGPTGICPGKPQVQCNDGMMSCAHASSSISLLFTTTSPSQTSPSLQQQLSACTRLILR